MAWPSGPSLGDQPPHLPSPCLDHCHYLVGFTGQKSTVDQVVD